MKRRYVVLFGDAFHWGTISQTVLDNHPNITFKVPKQDPQLKITILRTFKGGADGHVYLGLTQNFELIVVKEFVKKKNEDEDEREDENQAHSNELKYWSLINKRDCVPLGSKKNKLLLPFAFHCQLNENGEPYFEFDLNKWGSSTDNYVADPRLTNLSQNVQQIYDSISIKPEDALDLAVKKFAINNCVHDDIEWRHVALLPEISSQNDEIIGLTPILIDLSHVHEVADYERAMDEMSTNVNELLDILPSSNKKRKGK